MGSNHLILFTSPCISSKPAGSANFTGRPSTSSTTTSYHFRGLTTTNATSSWTVTIHPSNQFSTMDLPLPLQPTPHPPLHPSARSSRVFSVIPTSCFSSLTCSGIQTPMNGAWYELISWIVHPCHPHVSKTDGLLSSSTHSITMMCDSTHPINVTGCNITSQAISPYPLHQQQHISSDPPTHRKPMPRDCHWSHPAAGLILPTAILSSMAPLILPPPTVGRLAITSAKPTGMRFYLIHQCSPTSYPVLISHHIPYTLTAGSTFHIATSLQFNSYFPMPRMTMPILSTCDKRSQYSARTPPNIFSFAAHLDLGFATHFEYCDIIWLIKKRRERNPLLTIQASCLWPHLVYHCLSEPRHPLFPRLRGFPS